jgi:steroid delta-isomerase-like uncharacterized protein
MEVKEGTMSASENKALIRRYAEAMSKHKSAATIDKYVSDESLKRHIEEAEAGFPGYKMTLEDMIAEDDKVVIRTRLVATHRGDFMGIPATHKQVDVPGVVIYRIEDGKIAEHWLFLDTMTMMQQLGLAPEPTTGTQ